MNTYNQPMYLITTPTDSADGLNLDLDLNELGLDTFDFSVINSLESPVESVVYNLADWDLNLNSNLNTTTATFSNAETQLKNSDLDFAFLTQLSSPNTEDDSTMMSYSIQSPLSVSNEISVELSNLKPKETMRKTRSRVIDKKESNKAAATRYRNKKLQEKDQLFKEREEYCQKNAEMKKKILECQTEISFIKSLLVEALLAKNGIAKPAF